jgi:predicted Rossmann fold nucleotide-binding protein DprA/Smf involved in DNA uptake
MTEKSDAKKTAQLLKELKAQHADTVDKAQAMLKEQLGIRKQLKAAMKAGPLTIPEIAQAVDIPTDKVLWHVVAMKKYDIVAEVGQAGDYYQYALAKEKKQ